MTVTIPATPTIPQRGDAVPVSNRLTVLAVDIRALHSTIIIGSHALAERVIAAGQMLIEAKAALPHGEWELWLCDHAGVTARTARRYMQVTRTGLKPAAVAEMGIVGATRTVARLRPRVSQSEKPSPPDPVYLAW